MPNRHSWDNNNNNSYLLLQHKEMSATIIKTEIDFDDLGTYEDNSKYAKQPDSPAPSYESIENVQNLHTTETQTSCSSRKRARESEEQEEAIKHRPIAAAAMGIEKYVPFPHNKYFHLAYHWADKLGTIQGEQRIFAEKLINDAFYEAEFGRLDHGCKIIPRSGQDIT